MNANELADELDSITSSISPLEIMQATKMLRQQQAENEALKKEAALQRLSDFTQEADNEPVAWIIDANMTDCDDNFIWNTGDYPDWQVKDWIPLYTHTADLTDEEIDNIYEEFFGFKPKDKYAVEFARAILRKAQEK